MYQTWFCKKRLCPLCNWRKSMLLFQCFNAF
ncbi:hypothetical protein ABMB44_13520 [Levilactobacillus brevis]